MHVHREAGESPLQVDFSLQKDDQLYSIIIINTTILIILMAMHGEHHCSDGLLDHSSAAPLPTRPGWRMFSSTSQGSSPQPTKHKKFNLPPGKLLSRIPGSVSPPMALRPRLNTNHTHYPGFESFSMFSNFHHFTRVPCFSVAGLC